MHDRKKTLAIRDMGVTVTCHNATYISQQGLMHAWNVLLDDQYCYFIIYNSRQNINPKIPGLGRRQSLVLIRAKGKYRSISYNEQCTKHETDR